MRIDSKNRMSSRSDQIKRLTETSVIYRLDGDTSDTWRVVDMQGMLQLRSMVVKYIKEEYHPIEIY